MIPHLFFDQLERKGKTWGGAGKEGKIGQNGLVDRRRVV